MGNKNSYTVLIVTFLLLFTFFFIYQKETKSNLDLNPAITDTKKNNLKNPSSVDFLCYGCNVILISIDTLRADRLGSYGNSENITPSIDKFSEDSVVFKQSISHSSSTAPAHASIFTSIIPQHHGVSQTYEQQIPPEFKTIGEFFKDKRYKTYSHNGGGQLDGVYGFSRGFDEYIVDRSPDLKFQNSVDYAIEKINKSRKKFFLFLHTYEVHYPYTPSKQHMALFDNNYHGDLPDNISYQILKRINDRTLSISKSDEAHILNAYNAEIRSMDDAFQGLIDFLIERKIYNNQAYQTK